MRNLDCHFVSRLTEKELESELERLSKLIEEREATINDADRFAEVSRALSRIRSVRSGKFWP